MWSLANACTPNSIFNVLIRVHVVLRCPWATWCYQIGSNIICNDSSKVLVTYSITFTTQIYSLMDLIIWPKTSKLHIYKTNPHTHTHTHTHIYIYKARPYHIKIQNKKHFHQNPQLHQFNSKNVPTWIMS